jgi:hypothetical protein
MAEKEDTVGLNMLIPKRTHQEFKMLAALQQRKMKDMFEEMFTDYKRKYGSK